MGGGTAGAARPGGRKKPRHGGVESVEPHLPRLGHRSRPRRADRPSGLVRQPQNCSTCHKLAKSSVHTIGARPPFVHGDTCKASPERARKFGSAVTSTQSAALSPVGPFASERNRGAGPPRLWPKACPTRRRVHHRIR